MKEALPYFGLGEWVTWRSQSKGSSRQRTGKIVNCLAPGELPHKFIEGLGGQVRHTGREYGGARRQHSYLVCVYPPEGSDAKPALYWPRTGMLRAAKADDGEMGEWE